MPRALNKEEVMRFRLVVNGNETQKALYDVEKRTRSLKEETKRLREDRRKLYREGKRGSAEYKKLSATIKENEGQLKKNRVEMNRLQKEIGITGLTMGQLRKRARFLRQTLNNLVPGSKQYKAFETELKAINARLRQLRVSATAGRSGILRLADGFNRFAALGASVIATTTGIVLSAQKMIDFNGKLSDSQANVMRTTGLTRDEVDELTKSFGALNTRTSRIELLKLAETAGRLGFETLPDIQAFAENMNMIKVALEGDLSEKQILDVGKMVDVYKVATKESTNYHDALNKLGSAINEVSKAGNNQAAFQVEFLKRAAGVAASANLSAETMLGYAAAFDEAGQSAEISGTAMNKVIINMFKDTETFARIAGVELEDFNKILNEDTDAAFKLFLKGLKGNNEGFKIMVKRLQELDAGGARGVAALTALANNIDTLEARQKTANEALKEGTSLITEYNLKNNNLAANLEKIGRRLKGIFITDGMKSFLNSSLEGIGKLIGAIKDVNEEFAKETAQTYETAKANQRLAAESSTLLSEYERLTSQGVEPNADEKERLEIITLRLQDRLGESVVSIDEETGALRINTEAVREQIKIKRLAADQEASQLASRLIGAKESLKELAVQEQDAEKQLERRRRLFEQVNKEELEALGGDGFDPYNVRGKAREQMEGYDEMIQASLHYQRIQKEITEQEDRRFDITKKLQQLNFSESDIERLFDMSSSNDFVKRMQKIIDDIDFLGGNEDALSPDSTKGKERLANLDRLENEMLRIQNDNARASAELQEDEFQKQLELEDRRYAESLQRLQKSLTDEEELRTLAQKRDAALATGDTERFKHFRDELELRRETNQSILEAMATDERTHQFKVAEIIENAQGRDIEQAQERYQKEKQARDTAFNNELAALDLNEDEKSKLIDAHRKQELENQKQYLEKLIKQVEDSFEKGMFKGFDLGLLNNEQTQALKDNLDDLKEKLSEVGVELGKLKGNDDDDEFSFDNPTRADIFGMTPDDWTDLFDHIEEGKVSIEDLAQVMQITTSIWGQYNQMRAAGDRKRLQEFRKEIDEEKRVEQKRLDQGYINQRQYNARIEALEAKQKEKEAELQYKSAKRDKQLKVTQAVSNGALAVTNALATVPFPEALIMEALVTAMTGLQVGTILKQPLPARGFEDGLYDVTREQDGKPFRAKYKGYSKSGLTDGPSLFIAGEEGRHRPEMIINGRDYANFDPGFKAALSRQLGRVRGYEDGFYPTDRERPNNTPANNDTDDVSSETQLLFISAVIDLKEAIEKMEKNGIPAFLTRSMGNARNLQEDIDNYNRTREKARI